MNMWGVFAVVFACFFKISFAFSSFTIIDKYLNGTQLRIIQVESWYECIKVCQEEPQCISYNFDNKSECQINGHGVEERCQAHHELTSRAGWIYHQIREVNKKIGRSKTQGLCPCNCGASKQCRVEPDYGDVPEKALKSCSEILKIRRRHAPDGAYYLYKEKQPIFCHMTSIPGCGKEDGWTLVMKINGSKKTFKYNSKYWENTEEYQPENGANLEEKETKLATFLNPFTNICLGMKSLNSSSINWLMKNRSSGDSLFQIFGINKQNVKFALKKTEWSKLLPGSTLDDGDTDDGFIVKPPSGDGARVRIGVIAYPPTSSRVPISYIGFGAGGDAAAMYSGLTCGNVNGKNYIPAFCYILVK